MRSYGHHYSVLLYVIKHVLIVYILLINVNGCLKSVECIKCHSITSWSELLPLLEKKYGADRCYMFENNVFPNTVTLPTLRPQSPSWQNVSGVNILAHLYHEPIIAQTHFTNFKIIVNPRAVISPTVHGLLDSQKGCSWVDRNVARMYHTR